MPKKKRRTRPCRRLSTRQILVIMVFIGMWVQYMLRANISLAVLAIAPQRIAIMHAANCTNLTAYHLKENELLHEYVHAPYDTNDTFLWSPLEIGHVHASYFWGYFLSGIYGFDLAETWGSKWFVLLSTVIMTLLHIISPHFAFHRYLFFMCGRFFMGYCAGIIVSSMHYILGQWFPAKESRSYVWAMLGGALGVAFCWSLSGVMIEHGRGWPATFYFSGFISVFWCLVWMVLIYDKPVKHPCIRDYEKEYLGANITKNPCLRARGIVAWRSVWTSYSFWALLVLHFTNMSFLNFILLESPELLKNYLGYSYIRCGFLASTFFLFRLMGGFIFGWISECLLKKKAFHKTWFRKIFVIFSHLIPGGLLLCFWFIKCGHWFAYAILCISVIFNGAVIVTSLANAHDLAPAISGTINELITWIAMTTGFIFPPISGFILEREYSALSWKIIITVRGGLLLLGGVIFMILGSGDVQPWNKQNFSKQSSAMEFPSVSSSTGTRDSSETKGDKPKVRFPKPPDKLKKMKDKYGRPEKKKKQNKKSDDASSSGASGESN